MVVRIICQHFFGYLRTGGGRNAKKAIVHETRTSIACELVISSRLVPAPLHSKSITAGLCQVSTWHDKPSLRLFFFISFIPYVCSNTYHSSLRSGQLAHIEMVYPVLGYDACTNTPYTYLYYISAHDSSWMASAWLSRSPIQCSATPPRLDLACYRLSENKRPFTE